MGKVKLDTIKPWITSKITELLGGMEDDVVIDYVFNQLDLVSQYSIYKQINYFYNSCLIQSRTIGSSIKIMEHIFKEKSVFTRK